MANLFKPALLGLGLLAFAGAAANAQPYWRHRHFVAPYPYYGYAPYPYYGYAPYPYYDFAYGGWPYYGGVGLGTSHRDGP